MSIDRIAADRHPNPLDPAILSSITKAGKGSLWDGEAISREVCTETYRER